MKIFLILVAIVTFHTLANADCIDPFDQNGTCGNPTIWSK